MMQGLRACALAIFLMVPGAALAQAGLIPPERTPIRGMHTPALSPDASQICFAYRGDLWIVSAQGGEATRLTIHPAHDAYPRWSPDGKWIAFASRRYPTSSLNYDVFVIPASGGEPRRLTWHTNNDYPSDWSPDGTRLLLQAIRQSDSWQAVELDIESGRTRNLTNDRLLVRYAVYSPDGRRVAYTRCARTGSWWRPRYRGSANMDIWVKDLQTGKTTQLTTYEGMDIWPMFTKDGQGVCYVSDVLTPGVPNLVMAAVREPRPVSLTRHTSGAVTWPNMSRDGSAIVYTWDGDLYVFSFKDNKSRKLTIYADSDVRQNVVTRLRLTNGATELEVSPDGKTLGLVLRGDIWTIPADKGGEATRLTDTPAHDYDFMWSPDSTRIAFVSDRKGAFGIYVLDVKTREVREVAAGTDEASSPLWSSDGKLLAYLLSGQAGGLYVVPVDGSEPARCVAVSRGNNRYGVGITSYAWSPDSRWLAFSRRNRLNSTDIWVVPVVGGEAINVTEYPGSNSNPRWSSDGKYLVFLSSRDRPQGEDLYALPLMKPRRAEQGEGRRPQEGREAVVRIDFDGITERARRLTTSGVTGFELTPDGQTALGLTSFGTGLDVFSVPLGGGPVQRVTSTGDMVGIPRFASGASGRFWCLVRGGVVRSFSLQGPAWSGRDLGFEAIFETDLRAERRQAFHEFWRSTASGFYDPGMHGVDWVAVRNRYEPLLSGVETAEEFAFFLLAPMVGELNASHAEVSPPSGGEEPETANPGLLFDEDYDGPGVRVVGYVRGGPNDDDGPVIKPGEYVLKIGGQTVTWGETLWKALNGRADKDTEFLVNSEPKEEGARTVTLKPVLAPRIRELQYEEDVRTARATVSQLSEDRVAYVRVNAMDFPSLRQFERDLWGRSMNAHGVVLDLRDNGGGSTHDQLLVQLARTLYGYTRPRDGELSTQPWRLWDKPIVLLVNENSASDAELFALGFRTLKLGPIVGTRTPGYVIGTYSGTLQDGTSYRIPMWGWYSADHKNLENLGVRPDVEVPGPEGRLGTAEDEQLRRAVELVLRRLPKP